MSTIVLDGASGETQTAASSLLAWVRDNFGQHVATTIEDMVKGEVPSNTLLTNVENRIRQEARKRGVTLAKSHIYR